MKDFFYDFFYDFLVPVVSLFLIMAVLMGGILVAGIKYEEWKCNTFRWANPSLSVKWEFPIGCLVKTPGGAWVEVQYVNQYAPVQLDNKEIK